jgi:hypothetical protein
VPKLNAKKKGNTFELKMAHHFERITGKTCKRNLQFQGNNQGNPDISWTGSPIHIECKAVERPQFKKFMEQSKSEAKGCIPIVLHKFNRCQPTIMLELCDLVPFVHSMYQELDHLPHECPDVKGWCVFCADYEGVEV